MNRGSTAARRQGPAKSYAETTLRLTPNPKKTLEQWLSSNSIGIMTFLTEYGWGRVLTVARDKLTTGNRSLTTATHPFRR